MAVHAGDYANFIPSATGSGFMDRSSIPRRWTVELLPPGSAPEKLFLPAANHLMRPESSQSRLFSGWRDDSGSFASDVKTPCEAATIKFPAAPTRINASTALL